MTRSTLLLFTSILLTFANADAHAFDGQRQGFQLGLGLGAHTSALGFNSSVVPPDVESEQRLAISFLAGYGFSNRVIGQFGGKTGSILINDKPGWLTVIGVGGSYYLTEVSPSLYLNVLIGGASVALDDEKHDVEDDEPDSSGGWLIGIGYEIVDRLHLELSHAQADLTAADNTLNISTLDSSFLTLNYIWY